MDDTGRPLVVLVSDQLRAILEDAKRRSPGSKHVVTYRGQPLKTIRGGVQLAAKRANLHYGRADGITFHTLRHAAATVFARLTQVDGGPALSESERMRLMGHSRLETTQIYTHLVAADQRVPLERLSQAVPIADLVTHPRRRATREPISHGGKNGGSVSEAPRKHEDSEAVTERPKRVTRGGKR